MSPDVRTAGEPADRDAVVLAALDAVERTIADARRAPQPDSARMHALLARRRKLGACLGEPPPHTD